MTTKVFSAVRSWLENYSPFSQVVLGSLLPLTGGPGLRGPGNLPCNTSLPWVSGSKVGIAFHNENQVSHPQKQTLSLAKCPPAILMISSREGIKCFSRSQVI